MTTQYLKLPLPKSIMNPILKSLVNASESLEVSNPSKSVPTVKVENARSLKTHLIESFRDYWNNYLTLPKWAEHNGLSQSHAAAIINIGKALHDENAEFLKTQGGVK